MGKDRGPFQGVTGAAWTMPLGLALFSVTLGRDLPSCTLEPCAQLGLHPLETQEMEE